MGGLTQTHWKRHYARHGGQPDHPASLGVAVSERFKKSWRGWITSTEGYSFRVGSRTGIDYQDAAGELRIDSEVMSGPGSEVVVYTGSIPDRPERPRAQVLDRLRRAFEFMGWRLTLEDAWFD